jgi:hypothetical protein
MATQFNAQRYRSGRLFALAAVVLLVAGAGVKLLFVILHGFQIGGLLGGPNSAGAGEDAVSMAALNAILLLLNFVVYVATIVAFLLWLYRAASNLPALAIMLVLSIDRMQTERSKQLVLRSETFETPPPPPTFVPA